MKTTFNTYIQLLILSILAIFFTSVVSFEYYPDYLNLNERIKNNHSTFDFTVQKVFIDILNNFKKHQIYNMSDFTNLTFFIFNLLVCFFLVTFGVLSDKINKNNKYDQINFNFITALCFPSILLSITAISSEALYTILSIYIVSKINFSKGPFCLSVFSLLLLAYAFLLDKGNFFVLAIFIIGYIFFTFLVKYSNLKLFFFFIIIFSIFFWFLGLNLFVLVVSLFDNDKVIEIVDTIKRLNLYELSINELISRVVYFWITLTSLNLGDNNFSTVAILFYFYISLILFKKLSQKSIIKEFKNYFSNRYNLVLFIWLFLFPILFLKILPTHAFGKYYLFYIVIILKIFSLVLNRNQIYVIFVAFSLLSLVEKFLLL